MRGEALDESLFLGELRLLPPVGGFPIRLANLTFPHIEIVISGVGDDLAAVDFAILETIRFTKSRSCEVMSNVDG